MRAHEVGLNKDWVCWCGLKHKLTILPPEDRIYGDDAPIKWTRDELRELHGDVVDLESAATEGTE